MDLAELKELEVELEDLLEDLFDQVFSMGCTSLIYDEEGWITLALY